MVLRGRIGEWSNIHTGTISLFYVKGEREMVNWERKIVSVGIDLHTTQFTTCAITPAGDILQEEQYPTTEEGYASFIEWCHKVEEEYEVKVEMAIEATGNARYFRNIMQHEGFYVVVINTLHFKVVVQSSKKTDWHDAELIARFLLKDMLPESYLCDQETEELRKLLSERSDLVSVIVKTKNKIHNMLRGYGINTTGAQFQSKKKRQQLLNDLEDHTLYTKHAAKTLEMLLSTLTVLEEQVNEIELLIDEFIEEDEVVERLKTIPGVGKITASTLRGYIGDINRFDTYKQFAAYCGLTPFVKYSNEKGYTGHITKNGPTELRTSMVQAVMGMLRLQKAISGINLISKYKKMKRTKGSGISIIAFARKLSRIIYVMLKTGTDFDSSKLNDGEYDVLANKTQEAS